MSDFLNDPLPYCSNYYTPEFELEYYNIIVNGYSHSLHTFTLPKISNISEAYQRGHGDDMATEEEFIKYMAVKKRFNYKKIPEKQDRWTQGYNDTDNEYLRYLMYYSVVYIVHKVAVVYDSQRVLNNMGFSNMKWCNLIAFSFKVFTVDENTYMSRTYDEYIKRYGSDVKYVLSQYDALVETGLKEKILRKMPEDRQLISRSDIDQNSLGNKYQSLADRLSGVVLV